MASLQVQLIDEAREPVAVDPVNHALLVTDVAGGGGAGGSWAVNNGKSFATHYSFKAYKNGYAYTRIQTTEAIFIVATWSSDDVCTAHVYTDPTVTVESAATITNRKIGDATSSGVTATIPTTVTDKGTEIYSTVVTKSDHRVTAIFQIPAGEDILFAHYDKSGTGGYWASMNVDFHLV